VLAEPPTRDQPALVPRNVDRDPESRVGLERYNYCRPQLSGMTLSLEEECPECGDEDFYKAASTRLQLGRKQKWHCTNCDYGFVNIDGIDTRA
jgi:predicted RNA-binding Zn-ribbon protein involved in translation (DUF1610 family)